MTNASTQQYEDWFKQWFAQRENVPSNIEMDRNYFEQGLVDSFGFLELIFAVEKQYGVKFTEKHFKDKRFNTLAGLAQIVEEIAPADGASRP